LATLHLATLTHALPRILSRLKRSGAGQMAQDIAAEIERVDTSALPWAVQARARASYAAARAFLGTALPTGDRKLLTELLPKATKPGEAVAIRRCWSWSPRLTRSCSTTRRMRCGIVT
jgi:hypothetical protein